jgi:hypothetical protein
MAIYVDHLRDYRALMGWGVPGLWCHMISDDGQDSLHAFARELGLPRHRFQDHPRHPHYDLMPSSRAQAVALGAVEVTTREMAKILAQREERLHAQERTGSSGA